MLRDEDFMRAAIAKAEEGIVSGQTPFGACLVKDGKIVCVAHNQVWATTDITAHAEVQLIREACRVLDTIDLSGCDLYTTCEPCPMCFSASHWARVKRIIFGASIADAQDAGFHELCISADHMKTKGGSEVLVIGGVLAEEARGLFDQWKRQPGAEVY